MSVMNGKVARLSTKLNSLLLRILIKTGAYSLQILALHPEPTPFKYVK
jgi:hypothetical protein